MNELASGVDRAGDTSFAANESVLARVDDTSERRWQEVLTDLETEDRRASKKIMRLYAKQWKKKAK